MRTPWHESGFPIIGRVTSHKRQGFNIHIEVFLNEMLINSLVAIADDLKRYVAQITSLLYRTWTRTIDGQLSDIIIMQ